MIKIENENIAGLEASIRGMRNPMNSWDRSDSLGSEIGPNDLQLMKKLAKNGPVHAKYRRMIIVYADITAPLYWWKEFDTYKVGTVTNSCSTMHKIHEKEFTLDDFSHGHLFNSANGEDTDCYIENMNTIGEYLEPINVLDTTITMLNVARKLYLDYQNKARNGNQFARDHVKEYWWQIIQLLPSSYNQKRTVMLNYEVLSNIYSSRREHKLDEWRDFCEWIGSLPYSEIITCNTERR